MDRKGISKRLQEFRESQRLRSVRAFALEVNTDPSYFDKVLKGTADITEKILSGLQHKYNLNPRWVEFGELPKFIQITPQNSYTNGNGNGNHAAPVEEIVQSKNETIAVLKDQVATLKEETQRLKKQCETHLTQLQHYGQLNLSRLKTIVECQKLLRAVALKGKIDQKSLDAAGDEVDTIYAAILQETIQSDKE